MLHRLEFYAMGCEMLAVVESDRPPTQLAQVPVWFEAWEQALSRFRHDSELTRLNQIHERPVQVSDTLWQVLLAARQAEKLTHGLVTPTLLDAIARAGYDRPFDKLPPNQTPLHFDPVTFAHQPLKALNLDDSTQTVTLPSGVGLDFGGIAKGWAAHHAMQRLQAEGPALVDAGGDIAISGPRENGGVWDVGVANPFKREKELAMLQLAGCGVATSGKDRRH